MGNPASSLGILDYIVLPRGATITCQCASCIDKSEILLLKVKITCLENQIDSLNKIIDIYKKSVKVVDCSEEYIKTFSKN